MQENNLENQIFINTTLVDYNYSSTRNKIEQVDSLQVFSGNILQKILSFETVEDKLS